MHGSTYMDQVRSRLPAVLNRRNRWWARLIQRHDRKLGDLELNQRFLISEYRVYPDALRALDQELERMLDKIMREHSPLRVTYVEQREFRALATDRVEYELKVGLMRGRPANDFLIQEGLDGYEPYQADAKFLRNDMHRAHAWTGTTLYGRSQISLEAGRFHSLSGPALIHPCGHLEWFIQGKKLSPDRLREEGIEVLTRDEHRRSGERSWFRSDSDAFLFAMLGDRVGRAG